MMKRFIPLEIPFKNCVSAKEKLIERNNSFLHRGAVLRD
jgi:hypothetical protein